MAPTLYFGYGSNLWLHQMSTRCPSSHYKGVARLENYRWIINTRGYANVVEVSPSPSGPSNKDVVYGLVYDLTPADEDRLDKNEGVPVAYTKEFLNCTFWASSDGKKVDVEKPPTESAESMLVYIDRKRVETATPKEEYVYRMNRGIEDAVKMGVPEIYVKEVMREFIPAEEEEERDKDGMREKALRQAGKFEDESGVF